ncbi:MAG: hypothetical protein IJT77_00690, partial [Clostridia bacterium]|nr:hypothetical protein [Clostridia bacterium]
MNIFFYVNWKKENVRPVVDEWIAAVEELGLTLLLRETDAAFVPHLSGNIRFVPQPTPADTDAVVTFGGD